MAEATPALQGRAGDQGDSARGRGLLPWPGVSLAARVTDGCCSLPAPQPHWAWGPARPPAGLTQRVRPLLLLLLPHVIREFELLRQRPAPRLPRHPASLRIVLTTGVPRLSRAAHSGRAALSCGTAPRAAVTCPGLPRQAGSTAPGSASPRPSSVLLRWAHVLSVPAPTPRAHPCPSPRRD